MNGMNGMTAVNGTGYKPPELDAHPEVEALLRRLGHGPYLRDTLTAPPGRNDCWAGRTADGTRVFTKRLLGTRDDVARRMRNLRAFDRCAATALTHPALCGPRVTGLDAEAGVVAFAYVEEARGGAQLMVQETFTATLAHGVGEAVGQLHAARPGPDVTGESGAAAPTARPAHPDLGMLRAVPLAVHERLSFGETQAWGLMQRDTRLVAALEALREREERAPRVPVHGDLRVDQLLVTRDGFHLADWEEFGPGDAARDVGSFTGEWLYRSVLDIVTSRGDAHFRDEAFDHPRVLRRGAEKLHRLLPLVRAFWSGYLAARPGACAADPGLPARATAFAGLHTLDRLIAAAQRRPRLSAVERAAAGVGRRALLDPGRFASVLGLETPEGQGHTEEAAA